MLLKELNNAAVLYRNDVGAYPEALADLTVAEGGGPTGYQGPYLTPHSGACAPVPCDPLSGEPFSYDAWTDSVSAP